MPSPRTARPPNVVGRRSKASVFMSMIEDLVAGPVIGLGDGCADAAASDDDDLHDGSSVIGSRTTQTAHGAFCRM